MFTEIALQVFGILSPRRSDSIKTRVQNFINALDNYTEFSAILLSPISKELLRREYHIRSENVVIFIGKN